MCGDLIIPSLNPNKSNLNNRLSSIWAVGRNDFVISLKLGIDNSSDEETLKVICNFEEVPSINLNADQCDDIQDAILDYLSEKCFDELLVK
jgi:hypothetical protein